MQILVLSILFQLISSKESHLLDFPSKPENYDILFDDNVDYEGKQLYGCKESYQKSKKLKNCILGLYSCSFTDIYVYEINKNIGVIQYIINSDMQSSLTGNIEFQSCKFTNCKGGAIHIECSDDSRYFHFINCSFSLCQVSYYGSCIYFGAMNGKIEKCHFYDNSGEYEAGHISFHPPHTYSNFDEIQFIVTDNVFEMRSYSYTGCIYLAKNNVNLEFSNNQINSYMQARYYGIHFGNSMQFDFNNFKIQNNYMYPFNSQYFSKGNSDTLPENSFLSGHKNECPSDTCTDPNNCLFKCEKNSNSERTIAENSIVKVYHSTFNNLYIQDTEPGAAIYISINEKINLDNSNPIEIFGCTFVQCQADKGSAVYIKSVESHRLFNAEQCSFVGGKKGWSNSELDSTYGGGICIEANFLIVNIKKCIFDGNYDIGRGSGICFIFDLTDAINDDTNNDNDYSMIIEDCTFVKNEASDSGGAIHISIINGEPFKPIEICNCIFHSNSAFQNETPKDLPEMGGAISIEYDCSSSSSLLDSNAEFIVRVINCDFTSNTAYNLAGVFYISILNDEPSKPIEINHCIFAKNIAELSDSISQSGEAGDIYFNYESSSNLKKKSNDESNPSLRIIDSKFSSSYAKIKGGSMIFSIKSLTPTKPIEITNCSFSDCSSGQGYAIELTSSNPSVLLHFSECKFSKQCPIWFNSISGYFEKCTFTNIEKHSAIIYDCYPNENSQSTQFLKIEKCYFSQSNQLASLITVVPKSQSNFYFHNNAVEIYDSTNNTRFFGCSSDATLLGNWDIYRNTIYPPEDKFILDQNAIKINFPASCENGFICGELPSPTETETPTEELPSPTEIETETPTEELPSPTEEETETPSDELPSQTEIETPSEELPSPTEEDLNCKKDHRCSLDGTGQGALYLNISYSNFSHIYYQLDGGAIHLTNYGIFGIESIFYDCVSYNGGGGGIYFYLVEEIPNSFDLSLINFSQCSAVYGGAIYIYSNHQSNEIKITSSNFVLNKANKTPSSDKNALYGGGGIFLHARNANISHCNFVKNVAAGVKMFNKFDVQQKSIKEIETHVSISSCLFDFDDKTSSPSFYYVNGDKKEVPLEIENCDFIGKISDKEKHIDGISLSKTVKKSKLKIKLCKFSSANDPLSFYEIDSMEMNFKESNKNKSNDIMNSIQILSITALILITFIILILLVVVSKRTPKENNEIEQTNFD